MSRLRRWLIRSEEAGERAWQAADIYDAIEQHREAFPDEEIVGVRQQDWGGTRPTGGRISVIDPDSGRELFTGHLATTKSPWMWWHRVIPDQEYIDLPPKWRIKKARQLWR